MYNPLFFHSCIGVPKTNENRLQENPRVLEYIEGRNIVITRKEDGCSATYVLRNDEFSICGRNFTLLNLTAQSQHYFEIEDRYNIQSGMKKLGRELAIQGEIVGPKINGNRMKLSGNDFRVFNIKDLMTECYLSWEEVESVCASLGLHTVPVIYKGTNVFVCMYCNFPVAPRVFSSGALVHAASAS